ncbi:hypothetical protein [Sphingobium yanoikuyae]|nr:hypothetical protein [Sphingobium yanoikuyae]
MSVPDLSLLAKRRFAPLFVVQFLGALPVLGTGKLDYVTMGQLAAA